jgi:5-methylcytosine-specific restriction enzyme subunit McrC
MTPTALGDTAVATDPVTATGRGSEVPAAVPVQPPASTQSLDPDTGSGQTRGPYGPGTPYGQQADRPLTLREYGRELVALSSEQAGALNGVGDGKYLSIEPGEQPGHWQVAAHNYVGSINVGELQVLVRPKIPLRNLFLLLEVGLRQRDWRDEDVRFETIGDLLPALVSFLARTTKTTLARGLYHSYREHHDRLVALRGRIDIARQFAQPGVVMPTACRFTEFTAELIENSYLKAAVARSLRVAGVLPVDRRRLMQHLVTLEDVGDVQHRPADHDRVVFTRLNEHYQPALQLARLVLANLTLQDAVGATQASSFMLDMNELFERFVTERLRRDLRGRLDVKSQHSDTLDDDRTVAIRPDLVFRTAGSPTFVADIKYKLTDEAASGRHSDYYQLLAYTTALDLPEGVLIYCLDANRPDGADGNADSEAGPPATEVSAPAIRSVQVRHAGKVLHTYALDLSGTADDIEGNLGRLANWIVDRAAARAKSSRNARTTAHIPRRAPHRR